MELNPSFEKLNPYVASNDDRPPKEVLRNANMFWRLRDEIFFKHGGCHMLAWAITKLSPDGEFRVAHIQPKEQNWPGHHMYALNPSGLILDYQGEFKEEDVHDAFRKLWHQEHGPEWDFNLNVLPSETSYQQFLEYANSVNHRLPNDFAGDVLERAENFARYLLQLP